MTDPAFQTGTAPSPASTGELSLQPRSSLIFGGLLLLVTVVVFWDLFRAQFEFAVTYGVFAKNSEQKPDMKLRKPIHRNVASSAELPMLLMNGVAMIKIIGSLTFG